MNLTDTIHISQTLFVQAVDDEIILLDTQSENYFSLDPMGKVMWEQLSDKPSLQALEAYMLEHYDVSKEVLKKDIEVFITTLLTNKLITLGQM